MLKCQHLNIYEQDKFRAQLSWAWKGFITLGPDQVLIRTNRLTLRLSVPHWKNFFKKLILKKVSRWDLNHENLPCMQRVEPFIYVLPLCPCLWMSRLLIPKLFLDVTFMISGLFYPLTCTHTNPVYGTKSIDNENACEIVKAVLSAGDSLWQWVKY